MAYASLDQWLDEIEHYASRRERLAADCDLSFVMPWLETAWSLGGEAKAASNADSEDACAEIRKLLTEAGVPQAAFIDDHVKNAIAQRNILAECLRSIRPQLEGYEMGKEIDDALSAAFPSGVELRAVGDAASRLPKARDAIASFLGASRDKEGA